MQINCSLNPLYFGKTLEARAGIVQSGFSKPCSIYKLDAIEDKDYLENLRSKSEWKGNHYLYFFEDCLANGSSQEVTYALEDNEKNCLGLINLDFLCKNWSEVMFLETCPKYAGKNKSTKYIGETLLAFATQKAKTQNNDYLSIPSPSKRAINFYLKKCGFSKTDDSFETIYIDKKNYNKFIKQNARHTGVKMEFVA